MNFQEKLLDSFIAFEQDVDLLNPIHRDRKDALKRFEESGFPSKKDESWKYTSLKSLGKMKSLVIKKDCKSFTIIGFPKALCGNLFLSLNITNQSGLVVLKLRHIELFLKIS